MVKRVELQHKITYMTTGADGHVSTGHMVILPDMSAGNFHLKSIPTALVNNMDYSEKNVIIVGNVAFSNLVMTIDCYHQLITLRDSSYDFANDRLPRGSSVVNFQWVRHNQFHPGLLSVPAQLAGQHGHFIFDTGQAGVIITKAFSDKLKLHRRTKLTVGFVPHQFVVDAIPHAYGSLGGDKFVGSECIFPKLNIDADGSLGSFLMDSNCVTIDYPRKRILLEPYNQPSP